MNEVDIPKIIILLLKIALMVFTVIHILFVSFVIRRVLGMKQFLSTFRQLPIMGASVLLFAGLFALLIYIILLPI